MKSTVTYLEVLDFILTTVVIINSPLLYSEVSCFQKQPFAEVPQSRCS